MSASRGKDVGGAMTGLVLLNKPKGMTSFAAAAALRRIYGEKRVGHTGTLDPMATGVLPVLLGRATRLGQFMIDADKKYTARMKLGITTDTLDITGKVTASSEVSARTEDVAAAILKFSGEIEQIPPMFSALKQNGKRLYELAREGIQVERQPRKVTIHEIKLLTSLPGNEYEISVHCSKGTYIRTLCSDIGELLGCGACLTGLERTYAAGFSSEQCLTIEQIESDPTAALIPAQNAVENLPSVSVTENQKNRFLHGGGLMLERLRIDDGDGFYRVFCGDEFLGIGYKNYDKNELSVKCIVF